MLPSEPDGLPIRFRQAPPKIPPPWLVVVPPHQNERSISPLRSPDCSCAGAPQTIGEPEIRRSHSGAATRQRNWPVEGANEGDRGRWMATCRNKGKHHRRQGAERLRVRADAGAEPRQGSQGGRGRSVGPNGKRRCPCQLALLLAPKYIMLFFERTKVTWCRTAGSLNYRGRTREVPFRASV